MNEEKVTKTQGTKGFRSLTVMLISIICIMVSIPTIGLACLGVYYLRASMTESEELYEESMQTAIPWKLNPRYRLHYL